MQSIYNFIVSPYEERTTAKQKFGDVDFLLNTELQNHQYTSRHGVIKAVPKVDNLDLQVGDEIIVHHNVFRRFRDVRGNEKNSKSYFTDDMFFVYQDQIFAYKRGDSDWKAIARYTFVQPIVETRMFATETERDMVGIVKYTDGAFEVGDLVGFSPGTEYEFNIEGNRVYRVPTHKITIKYEYQGDEKEYNPSWT